MILDKVSYISKSTLHIFYLRSGKQYKYTAAVFTPGACCSSIVCFCVNQLDICLFAGIIHCQITNIIIICREKSDTRMSFRYIIHTHKLWCHIRNDFLAEHMRFHFYNFHKQNPFASDRTFIIILNITIFSIIILNNVFCLL